MGKRILILEDDINIMNNIVELLEAEQYEVYAVSNGKEGLEHIKKHHPDLILCDIMMPHINGIDFFKHIRKDYDTKLIPFIFLTAKTDLTSIREGLSLGADDYITKPFLAEDLLNAIKIRLTRQDEFNHQFESLVKNINMYIPHELRTPLVAIIGFSRLVLTDLDNLEKNEIKEMTERILWSAQRLHNRIEKFIYYSDLNLSQNELSKNHIIDYSNIDNGLFYKMISEHYFICDRLASIKASFEPAAVKISEYHLERLLKEIVENAVKFSDSDSEISAEGKISDKYYLITIKDCGIGMNEEEMKKIGLFQQFSREVFSQDGNGLGLVVSKKIIQMNDGDISFESKKDGYTIVRVKLPLYKS